MNLAVIPVEGLGEVPAGADLAGLVAGAADLRDGDVVVVASKIVSKAEGVAVALEPGETTAQARARLARAEAVRVVAESPHVLVVETRHGLVCANAGIDASNVDEGFVLLLPADPDASARRLRAALRRRAGVDVGVIIADTFGRPWRVGQTDVAIGCAGLSPLRDERGTLDRGGRRLDVTLVAVADELAGAADLVRRKGAGVPVVVVRGFDADLDADLGDDRRGARALVRPPAEDLFRLGRGGLTAALAEPGAVPDVRPGEQVGVTDADLDRAWAAAAAVAGDEVTLVVLPPQQRYRVGVAGDDVRSGVAAGVLVAALRDLGYLATVRPSRPDEAVRLVVEAGRDPADRPGGRR